jgi:hypothetical protein
MTDMSTRIDEAACRKAWIRFKGALTRARNSKNPDKVIAVIDDAERWFEDNKYPFPDAWPHWESLRDSARMAKHHGYPFNG